MIDGGIGANELVAQSPLRRGRREEPSHAVRRRRCARRRARAREGRAFERDPHRAARTERGAQLVSPLRETEGRDALWGLVRVEMRVTARETLTERADELSRWLLAESSPLAAPDPRWDRMAYGIRSAEEFLRATTS